MRDAMIELCILKKEKAMSKTEKFVMIRGKVLKDTLTNDARLNMVRGNETEELALYHLYTNSNSRQFFEVLPDSGELKTMLDEYGERFEAERNARYGAASGVMAADKVVNDAMDKAVQIKSDAEIEAAKIIAEAKVKASGIVSRAERKASKATAAEDAADPLM